MNQKPVKQLSFDYDPPQSHAIGNYAIFSNNDQQIQG